MALQGRYITGYVARASIGDRKHWADAVHEISDITMAIALLT